MTDELRSRVLALPAQDREELAYALLESLYADTAPDPVRLVGPERSVPNQLRDGQLRDGRDLTNVVDLSEARARLLPS